MSMYANLDTGEQTQIASNTGWGDFCRWVDGLPVDDYAQIITLREHGWSQELDVLKAQLMTAIKDNEPSADVTSVGAALIDFIDKRGDGAVLVISDGTGPDESDATKAIDATDEARPWSDEEIERFTEDDVKFALGSSTGEMRELLKSRPASESEGA